MRGWGITATRGAVEGLPHGIDERGAGVPQKAPVGMWTSCGRAERRARTCGIWPKLRRDTSCACNVNALVICCYPIMEMDQ